MAPPPGECEVVQHPYFADPGTVPLVLIHDGGGTTFPYHCLEPLRRPVYGIANPHFRSGAPWPGGLPQMAETYATMIRRTVRSPSFPKVTASSKKSVSRPQYGFPFFPARPRILLGGWSLGGMLALQVAWLLEDDPDVEVMGLLLIDSICPLRASGTDAALSIDSVQRPGGQPVGRLWDDEEGEPVRVNERLARRAMRAAVEMVRKWEPPAWGWEVVTAEPEAPRRGDSDDDDDDVNRLRRTATKAATMTTSKMPVPSVPYGPPPTVFLKARDYVPTKQKGDICTLDVLRDRDDLGWSRYHVGFLGKIIEVDGHHFDLFEWERVAGTTEKIREACELLEGKGTARRP
ncbi:hypothetical protein ACRALDRAFT_2052754 [Sodiomyces alcalophilus JCM 7366]|uniref:uncharacterized protein n=1 Tax=Sodiomyces alcalophilus JCM 7366 TaxID=591952 RepID=UPI0039B3CAF0